MIDWQIEPCKTKFICECFFFVFCLFQNKNTTKEKYSRCNEVYMVNPFSTKMPNRTLVMIFFFFILLHMLCNTSRNHISLKQVSGLNPLNYFSWITHDYSLLFCKVGGLI